tara:strand:+ start:1485 stop:2105 length:621 start_codon:yes stop_codon:yes gene_type:complete
MALDKINALSGPPGHSLTDSPKKWAWEKPAMYSDPNEAIDHIVSGLENKSTQNDMIKMMFAGISVEELVTQISFKGFMEGAFTPDVAELIKPSIAIYLLGMAEDEGFVPKMYSKQSDNPESDDQVTDDTMFSIMQERNPEMFAAMLEQENEEKRMLDAMHEQDNTDLQSSMVQEEQLSNSFMRTPDSVIQDADIEEEQTIQEERVV